MEISFLNTIFDSLIGSVYAIYTTDENGEEQPVLTFDSITEYGFEGKATIISHPIEQGFKATEFKYCDPATIEMSGVVSENSLIGQLGNKLMSLAGFETEDKISKVRETLEEYRKNLYVVNIKSRTAVRENYTLQAYSIKESPDNFGLLEVDMTFEEVMLRPKTYVNVKKKSMVSTVKSGISQVVKKVGGK